MRGETNLRAVLAGMTPLLREPEYVFVSLPHGTPLPDDVIPFATVREDEGITLVVEAAAAQRADFSCGASFRAITLAVHSSLDAVGFIAAVAAALAAYGIPANAFAGVHHDHVFVPAGRADDALAALKSLQQRTAGEMP